jgi:hypothetical protein
MNGALKSPGAPGAERDNHDAPARLRSKNKAWVPVYSHAGGTLAVEIAFYSHDLEKSMRMPSPSAKWPDGTQQTRTVWLHRGKAQPRPQGDHIQQKCGGHNRSRYDAAHDTADGKVSSFVDRQTASDASASAIGLSMLIGAFIAGAAATIGGKRDEAKPGVSHPRTVRRFKNP